ncbi:hypothetical protein AVEN_150860-1 [Araneus ventricosus]|uniref:Mariner Mos1 transposase n=1 Tax=Araneus ventricosus TaxID=182803 RepID=A0A4Y1ZMC4_ARAVE|nr:hypothetical protein AVEN_7697-1 [Araneus ventricosus]GBL55720.1 hypothetical protein AVEN_256934-1 [Araneus ventricosus]GBL55803.1 hypothetical protein AVEN_75248-1 [Araneus ventricosus]GBL55864.1 hypothetical protein AVEN_150860-1 [Araneus ventricosus]
MFLQFRRKGNSHWAIVTPSDENALGMLGDGVILLHDNTYTARTSQELLRKFKLEIWSHPTYSEDLASNLGSTHLSEQSSLQTVMGKQVPRTGSMGRDLTSTKPG